MAGYYYELKGRFQVLSIYEMVRAIGKLHAIGIVALCSNFVLTSDVFEKCEFFYKINSQVLNSRFVFSLQAFFVIKICTDIIVNTTNLMLYSKYFVLYSFVWNLVFFFSARN